MSKQTVLLIGARGFLGSQVLDAVLAENKYNVRALIREGSNADAVEAKGAAIVRGDMMEFESLKAAMRNVDVVINTANGYMQGHPEIDTTGANNVADAVKEMGVKRYIYCSVLTAEKAVGVEHFEDKKLAENYMKEKGIDYIALRPGAFLDQSQDFLGGSLKRGDRFAVSMWNKKVAISWIYTPDLAQYFSDAIGLPATANRKSIDVGWSRNVSMQDVVGIAAAKLDRSIGCISVPWLLRVTLLYTVGWFSPFVSEVIHMFNYFDTGEYIINDTSMQEQYFGKPPTPEEVVHRYVDKLLKDEAEAEAATD